VEVVVVLVAAAVLVDIAVLYLAKVQVEEQVQSCP
jgi:HAMP domain-containing protein